MTDGSSCPGCGATTPYVLCSRCAGSTRRVVEAVERLTRERDEARAEVERLRLDYDACQAAHRETAKALTDMSAEVRRLKAWLREMYSAHVAADESLRREVDTDRGLGAWAGPARKLAVASVHAQVAGQVRALLDDEAASLPRGRDATLLAEAERRGYERGVKDATAVCQSILALLTDRGERR